MKKKFFGALVVVAIAVSALINVNLNKVSNKGNIALANVEALAGETPSNYGPGEFHDCKGFFTGDWKACMSTNNAPCTETACK